MSLEQKIRDRSATVGVIGLGYVGLPLCHAFHEAGFGVLGFDVDQKKIDRLNAGENYLKHLGEELAQKLSGSDRFEPTTDFARLSEADVVISCVPTPLGKHLEPDLSYVERTTADIAAALRPGQLVVLESTTYPRTTREIMLPAFEAKGLACGSDDGFYLAYSPEREDPGRQNHNTQTIPKLVGGIDDESGRLAELLYSAAIAQVHRVDSAEIAEAAKLLENIFRAVNIALVNEMKVVLTKMGINIFDVVEAASTKPFGFMPFYPGPGLGGHCIPIDPYYLTWKAREVGIATRFIELAGEVNRDMPGYVVQRLAEGLNRHGLAISRSKVLVLGLAYKPNVDDVRESPSFEIIEKLIDAGADVQYNDPHIPKPWKGRKHDLTLESQPVTPETLAGYDAVVVATHHDAYDWQMIADHAKLIIDTRNALRDVSGDRSHIVIA
ncbi:nucleotide sugar dehydrogenase [Algisphaera agarilytica]|uniref:UDP-N-acetyl-D-glucosamine dehydrogenase n=1 Tax=Algisphaera agarilytica TaxID=1385975 RepID=A0A7X0HAG6_9BACT|nr:nucleotide sugar dehydrogenase [Algisphaera agarilytica]MBB6430779.1 UDP-N-acetyl-D-glucosamine dehydrogenase [Algisphaera agarilytica]